MLAAALAAPPVSTRELPQDRGASGAWQALLKLGTTASLMHTTAHPDDEHGGMLALMSRGLGVRTSLLTLNRGEAGDNAIGPELFDALGLIRTEELRVAARYYGLDRQYFSTVVDYGFSKRLDEAIEQWGRERVLRDMVRAIRIERPLVIVSRFQGNERDGHGQHQAAGLLTQEAYKAAADPAQFPEQVAEGLRPWQARKLYMGGARENEAWHVRIDPGQYDPILGESYQTLARRGLSFQRSQTSGRFVETHGPAPAFYVRLASAVDAPEKEKGFFDGIDTSVAGLPRVLRGEAPGAGPLLERIEREAAGARESFAWTNPAASAPALARGLAAVREARKALAANRDVDHALALKEEQFAAALAAALGVDLTAIAVPAGTPAPSGPFAQFAPAPTLGPVVPGQAIDVRASATVRGTQAADLRELTILAAGSAPRALGQKTTLQPNQPFGYTAALEIPRDAPLTRPHVSRPSIAVNHYTPVPGVEPSLPSPGPAVALEATLAFEGVPFTVRTPVRRREARLPYGYAELELAVVPPLSVAVSPRQAMVPAGGSGRRLEVKVEVTNYRSEASAGTVSLGAPAGWKASPATAPFELPPGGARTQVAFTVSAPAGVAAGSYALEAAATLEGKPFGEGVEPVAHRDLETRYRYRPATVAVAAIDVSIARDLTVGYVMGVGDEVPAAIEQLGAKVELLDAQALASAPLDRFDAIVLGTRAYAVRSDLRANNNRLLDYVRAGGNLIVLYNTQEFDPRAQAPYPARLPGNAEEVAEQSAAVAILEPSHPVFTAPNRISSADFDGWIEQRGSKFWSEWDSAYTPLLESHDRGQAPQRGGWLHARAGKGHYSYVAYAFHRQLPYGVPGAYRLMANLLSLGKTAK